MADLFDAQTKDTIEQRLVQVLKTVTGTDKEYDGRHFFPGYD